jgi:hypothetical protein
VIGSAQPSRIALRAEQRQAFASAIARVATIIVFGVVPALLWALILGASQHRAFGMEFAGNFYRPAQEILAGSSPYHSATIDSTLAAARAGHPPAGFDVAVFASYPPPALLVGIPFTVLGLTAASLVWMVLLTAAAGASLALLGVRDWRCYGAAACSITLICAVTIGSVTPLLLLAAAITWRWRDNARVVALALGGVIALKLILWPLLVWLWVTGRRLQAVAAFSVALVAFAIGWVAIGFPSLTGYAHLLSSLNALENNRGYSLVRVGHLLGASSQVAELAAYAGGAILLLAVVLCAKRGFADQRTFTLAIVASLALTPIVWQSYFAILLVPIALNRPRLDVVWLLPLAFWLAPTNLSEDRAWPVIATGAVVVMLVVALLRQPRPATRMLRPVATARAR